MESYEPKESEKENVSLTSVFYYHWKFKISCLVKADSYSLFNSNFVVCVNLLEIRCRCFTSCVNSLVQQHENAGQVKTTESKYYLGYQIKRSTMSPTNFNNTCKGGEVSYFLLGYN